MIVRLILLLFLGLVACRHEDSTPELSDPIFADMVRRMEEAQRKVDQLKRDYESIKKDYENAGIQNGEIKVQRQTLFDKIQDLDKLQQKTRFMELEADSRKAWDRKSYKKAFDANKDWPDPEEFRLYKFHQKLVGIPKSYDETHHNRLEARKPANKEPQKKSAKGGEAKPAAHE